MKSKPDDRSDNAEKIKRNIDHTIRNMELADDMIARTDDCKTKEALKDKNCRRGTALDSLRNEVKDEALHQGKKQ